MLTSQDIRGREDLSDQIDILNGSDRDMQFLSFINNLPKTKTTDQTKHEWQDDALRSQTLTLTASASGADWDTDDDVTLLPVTAVDKAKLKVGDIVRLPTGPEYIRVESLTTGANTIGVTRAGTYGGTASAQGSAAFTATRVANAQEDGSDPVEPAPTDPTERYNYIQIIEDPYHISAQMQMKHITSGAERERQRMLSLKNAMQELNSAMYWGRRVQNGEIRTMGGLREWATASTSIGGNITPAGVRGIVQTMIDAGGYTDQIHVSPTDMKYMEIAFANEVVNIRRDNVANLMVMTIRTMGITIDIYMDKHVLVGEHLYLDSSRIKRVTQNGNGISGSFASYEVDKNGKQFKDHVVGFYGLEVNQPAAALHRATGVTGGATS